jgi:hypothetical protein
MKELTEACALYPTVQGGHYSLVKMPDCIDHHLNYPEDRLCECCQRLMSWAWTTHSIEDISLPSWIPHQPTYVSLAKSAASGCKLCSLLKTGWEVFEDSRAVDYNGNIQYTASQRQTYYLLVRDDVMENKIVNAVQDEREGLGVKDKHGDEIRDGIKDEIKNENDDGNEDEVKDSVDTQVMAPTRNYTRGNFCLILCNAGRDLLIDNERSKYWRSGFQFRSSLFAGPFFQVLAPTGKCHAVPNSEIKINQFCQNIFRSHS